MKNESFRTGHYFKDQTNAVWATGLMTNLMTKDICTIEGEFNDQTNAIRYKKLLTNLMTDDFSSS